MTEILVPGKAQARVRLREVADGVFAYLQQPGGWCVNNAGVLLGPDGPVVIDTAATEHRAQRLRDALERLTSTPPRLLLNTHFHGDHTFGNCVVGSPETVVVAHEQARAEMIEAGLGLTRLWPGVAWGRVALRLPDLTYQGSLTLHLGARRAEVLHVGPAHTTNDSVVWLAQERVLFAGDVLMPGCTPFVLMGSVHGSLRAIARLRALEPATIVGGHGPVCGPEVLDETRAYFEWLLEVARQGLAAGLTPLQAAREAGDRYRTLLDPERLVGNLHRAYSELRGEPEGTGLDVVGAFQEMVEFNDGRLPHCFA